LPSGPQNAENGHRWCANPLEDGAPFLSDHTIERDGVRIAYRRLGTGPPIALVQGLAFPGAMWLWLPKRLAAEGFTVLVPDNRGSGSSPAPWRPWTLRAMADDLAAVLEYACPGQPALVVGISLGGMIALQLAIHHPTSVRGLVLAATTSGLPHWKLPRPGHLLTLVRSALGRPQMDAALQRVLVHPDSRRRDPTLFDEWDRVLARGGRHPIGVLGQMLAVLTHGTRAALPTIACPTEILAGDTDLIIPPANAEDLARHIPGAALNILPCAGHAFPLEAPDALPGAIRRVAARSSTR